MLNVKAFRLMFTQKVEERGRGKESWGRERESAREVVDISFKRNFTEQRSPNFFPFFFLPSSSFFPADGMISAVQYCWVDNGHAMNPFKIPLVVDCCVKNETSSPIYRNRNTIGIKGGGRYKRSVHT